MAIELVIGTTKIVIHESIVNWLILCVLMSIFFIVAGKKIKKADPRVAPKGFVLLCECVAKLGTGIISGNLGKRTRAYIPFFGTLIFMMAPSNLLVDRVTAANIKPKCQCNTCGHDVFVDSVCWTERKRRWWKTKRTNGSFLFIPSIKCSR